MDTNRDEQHLRRGFSFLDSGLLACFPAAVFNTYEIIRRHVWRSEETGDPAWRAWYRKGKLAATVSQDHIAALTGREKRTISEHIATFKELGWVEVIQDPQAKRPATYIVGERVKNSKGMYSEVFFSSSWLSGLLDAQRDEAEKQFGPGTGPTRLDVDTRIAICRQWIETTSQGKAKQSVKIKREKTTLLPCGTDKNKMPTMFDGWRPPAPQAQEQLHPQGGEGCNWQRIRIENPSGEENKELEYTNAAEPTDPSGSLVLPASPPRAGECVFRDPALSGNGWSVSSDGNLAIETSGLSSSARLVSQPTELTADEQPVPIEPVQVQVTPDEPDKSPPNPPEPTVDQRMARLAAVAAGTAVATYDHTGETFRERAERARTSRVESLARKAAKLKNFDSTKPGELRQAVKHLEGIWSRESKAKFGPVAGVWQPADRKMCETLLKSYKIPDIEAGIKYLVGCWDSLNKRIFKGNGGKIPTIAVLHKLHASIIPESVDFADTIVVADEWRAWWEQHPNDNPPDDLDRRYQQALPKLRSIGVA